MSLNYRGGMTRLAFCPRCEVTCGCGGHRVAQAASAVPRSESTATYLDEGFWCWCCFSQTWNRIGTETKSWLRELGQRPEHWIGGKRILASRPHAAEDWATACRSLNFGTEWVNRDDDANCSLVAAAGVGDLPFATKYEPHAMSVAVSAGTSRLIERALAKDARAHARGKK